MLWRRRVNEIEVNINYSPCALCSSTLNKVRQLLPNVKKASLIYNTVYSRRKIKTTKASLAEVSGWKISGPEPKK